MFILIFRPLKSVKLYLFLFSDTLLPLTNYTITNKNQECFFLIVTFAFVVELNVKMKKVVFQVLVIFVPYNWGHVQYVDSQSAEKSANKVNNV